MLLHRPSDAIPDVDRVIGSALRLVPILLSLAFSIHHENNDEERNETDQ
jgi:hypothetical protein